MTQGRKRHTNDYSIIHNYYNTAALLTLACASLIPSCAIIPDRNTITMNKIIELDERAVEKLNVGVRLEWIR